MKNNFWNFNSSQLSNLCLVDSSNNSNYTYRDLKNNIENITEKISSRNKALAFLFCNNSVNSIIYYLAMLNMGHAVLLLDSKLNEKIKSLLIERYLPKFIFSPSNFSYNGYERIKVDGSSYFLSRSESEMLPIHSELAVLLSTSGTTGSPKLVRLSYKNIQSNAESISKYLAISSDEKTITSLPMSYSYGLSVINSHILKYASIVLTDKSVIFKDFWNLFNLHHCTSFAGVPYTYQMLKKTGFNKIKLSSLRYMTQAGGKLSEEFIKYFLDYALLYKKKFFVMYGQTEATARISYVPFESLKMKIGSIGIPIPDGKIKILNGNKEVLETGMAGEIIYEGPNVMMGYAERRSDLSKGDELDGKLRTGDLAYRDKDGFFFITGRIKRFIKIFGLRINLDEVEKMLQNEFHISLACVGTDDSLKIALQSNEDILRGKVRKKVSNHYKINPSCISVVLLEKIPVKNTGKYDYSKVQEMLDEL